MKGCNAICGYENSTIDEELLSPVLLCVSFVTEHKKH